MADMDPFIRVNSMEPMEYVCVCECVCMRTGLCVCCSLFGHHQAITMPCPLVPTVTLCIITPAFIILALSLTLALSHTHKNTCKYTHSMPACVTQNPWPKKLRQHYCQKHPYQLKKNAQLT